MLRLKLATPIGRGWCGGVRPRPTAGYTRNPPHTAGTAGPDLINKVGSSEGTQQLVTKIKADPKLRRTLPWERIELTSLYLQNSALTTKQPRLLSPNLFK